MTGTKVVSDRGHAAGGGIIAGVIGGVVLSILLIITYLTKGGDVWMAMKGSAAPFFHERAQQPGFDAAVVVLGLACHFAIAIVWGVLFSQLAFGISKPATVIAGAAWGIVVWLVMYYLVLPVVGLAAVARSQPIAGAVILHVVFGLAVGISFLPFQRTRPWSFRAPAT